VGEPPTVLFVHFYLQFRHCKGTDRLLPYGNVVARRLKMFASELKYLCHGRMQHYLCHGIFLEFFEIFIFEFFRV
jgi:hypothetical protein